MQTILVADNNPEYLQKYASFFLEKKIPCKLITANNGKMAVQLASRENPDIILMSWQMPVMDGISAIKVLKKNPQLKDIPIIIATGHRISSEDLKLAFEAGASDYMRKPVDKVELMARLHRHINISKYIKSLKSKSLNNSNGNEWKIIKEKKALDESCEQLTGMIHFILNERKSIISRINHLRLKKKDDKEIMDYISSSLSKNYTVFKHFNSECELFLAEDDFIKRLLGKHPCLLPSDIQLCLMLKKNLPSKEIASLTYRCINTVKVARSKLRSKLQLENKENLVKYLIGI